MEPVIENSYGKYWIKDGIIFFVYNKNLELDIISAQNIVSDRLIHQNNQSYPLFADCRGIKTISREARDYLAKEGSRLLKASALISDSPVHNTIGNFFLQISKPMVPTKVFYSENEALKWLEKFKNTDNL